MWDHAEHGHEVGPASVTVMQVENEDHSLTAPTVEVYVDSDVADLTPAQARELAGVLIAKAEQAEARA